MKNHTVVIGYGVKGRTAVKSLLDSEEDGRSIVVITGSPAAASEASEQGSSQSSATPAAPTCWSRP